MKYISQHYTTIHKDTNTTQIPHIPGMTQHLHTRIRHTISKTYSSSATQTTKKNSQIITENINPWSIHIPIQTRWPRACPFCCSSKPKKPNYFKSTGMSEKVTRQKPETRKRFFCFRLPTRNRE